ncbi:hypothetical protein [Legionella londiniensis]|nr:hypothetical protein [Legionella londiniensis]STX94209.1 Uncharacterised protein [Legionella londiniensis]
MNEEKTYRTFYSLISEDNAVTIPVDYCAFLFKNIIDLRLCVSLLA